MSSVKHWLWGVSYLCLGISAPAAAADDAAAHAATDRAPESRPSFSARPEFTGRWGGARDSLAQAGVTVTGSYLAGLWGVADGGRDPGVDYEGLAQLGMTLDGERLIGWRGGFLELSSYSYHGGLPSERVGQFHARTVSGNEATPSFRFFEILLRQQLFERHLEVEIGQLATDDDYYLVDAASELMNGTFGWFGLAGTRQAVPMFPLASPGVHAKYRSAFLELQVGTFVANVGEDVGDSVGFGWTFDDGVTALAEARVRFGEGHQRGTVAAGAVVSTARLDANEPDSGAVASGGGYLLTEQQLSIDEDSGWGASAFARVFVMGPEPRVLMRTHVDGGLRVVHPFVADGAASWTLAAGVAHFSNDYLERQPAPSRARNETIVELTWKAPVLGWLTIQPDLQWIHQPSSGGDDAWVLALRTQIVL